ncbi:MAG: hypothetical protein Q9221_009021 [Calogaya cf. arnoldii]
MADIFFDDDEDDDFWIEDTYDDADDLAEHTMQSPVLINYDPTYDPDVELDDWEDWSGPDGDFFDQETPKKKRRRLHDLTHGKHALSTRKNQTRVASMEGPPEISLGDAVSSPEDETIRDRSIVKWKVRQNSPQLPIFEPGQQEKVSVLKDWKERFKPSPSDDEKSKASATNGTQRAIAVVIETRKGSPFSSDSKSKRGLDESAPKATKALSHRNRVPNHPANINLRGGSTPKNNGPTTTRKRKLSPLPDPGSEPMPKRQSTRQNGLVHKQQLTTQAGQKRTADDELEQPELQTKKAKVFDDAMMKKENLRPKLTDNAATKKENIRPKASDNAATKKENIRPKAAAVSRRSARHK